jgi:uncharacterized damage-inducible protein DinB
MQVTDLIRYNHTVRELYFDKLFELPWGEVVLGRGLSFDSLRGVFLHLTLVEDRWISYTLQGRFSEWCDPDFDDFKDRESLRRYMQQTRENTEKYLSKLTTAEIERKIVLPWSEKPNVRLDVEACLTHMVLECMIHYGELSAALWQMGLEAPYLGFWRFKLQTSKL